MSMTMFAALRVIIGIIFPMQVPLALISQLMLTGWHWKMIRIWYTTVYADTMPISVNTVHRNFLSGDKRR